MDRRTYLALLLFAATGLTIWAFGLILLPFLVPIAWAMCLVTVTGGLYRRLARVTRRPALAAFGMTFATAVLVLGPLVFLGTAVVTQAIELSEKVTAGGGPSEPTAAAEGRPSTGDKRWDDFLVDHPRLDRVRRDLDHTLAPLGTSTRKLADEALTRLSQPVATGTFGVLQTLGRIGFGFIVMLATLFFLYRDAGKIRAVVMDLVPLTHEETARILDTLRDTAFAAVVGGLVTALIQGALGGLAFVITGVPGALLWGFVMAVLSLLPVGGSAFVWAPTMVYFFLTGDPWKGWFLLVWGIAVIGSSDNLLRPWLMRRAGAGGVHPLLLFFAILSGIGLFGVSGIVFGPLLVAFVLVVVRIYREHFGKPSSGQVAAPPAGG